MYICRTETITKKLEIMNAEFTQKDQEQLENLMMFAKLNNYILETEEDMKQLLKDWVNNGLKLMKKVTENKQCMDMMFDDYMTQQGLN